MVKSQLIQRIADKLPEVAFKDIEASTKLIVDLMADALQSKNRIEIRQFGSFSIRERKPRPSHNPKTGEQVLTPAKSAAHFKPGKELRERVNASRTQCGITQQKDLTSEH